MNVYSIERPTSTPDTVTRAMPLISSRTDSFKIPRRMTKEENYRLLLPMPMRIDRD